VTFAFILAEKAQFPIGMLCEQLEVSRPGYYAWLHRPPSKRRCRDAELGAEVAEIHAENRRIYGSPRVHHELKVRGRKVGRKRVARIMRERGIVGKRRRRFRITTDSNHTRPIAPNVLNRNFSTTAPDLAWVGDITYIWTREGWLYLAVLIDLFSRRVVGWAMKEQMTTDLVLDALGMAVANRRPPRGLVQHTDRGSQYASAGYVGTLAAHGMVQSMSRRGNCWDNAVAESFFASLKHDLVFHADFATRAGSISAIFEYIEVFYNRRRRHSYLGYATPSDFESRFEITLKAA
jgi:transposase InsO family protein